MRVLVTGHDGYLGHPLAHVLLGAGHELVGLDTFLFDHATFGPEPLRLPAIRADIRDVTAALFEGFDAVVHLAALSNDPLGDYRPETTFGINHVGAVAVAEAAKAGGVHRFVLSSSCSLYGAQGDAFIDEGAAFNPVTAYGESKVLAEREIARLADATFSPVFLRNATAYGYSPRLRGDLVVNNLVGHAVATGDVLVKSDGTAWRPLVHVEDIAHAVRAVLEAPRELVHAEAFNVGATTENFRVRDVAELVEALVPGAHVRFAPGGGVDPRNYRVDCDKISSTLGGFRPAWSLEQGIEQLRDAYVRFGMSVDALEGAAYGRIRRVRELVDCGRLTPALRWADDPAATIDVREVQRAER